MKPNPLVVSGEGLPPHAWFTGFIRGPDGRTYVITVVVEHAGEGSEVAAPIFRQVAQAAVQP